MGPTAQVGKIAVCVEGNGSVLKFADELAFVLVTLCGESFHCLLFRNLATDKLFVLACKFNHLVLDGLQFCLRQLPASEIDVIVATVLNCRTDSELDSRIQSLKGFCHQMGG